ncbi:D-mannonate dehydratase [Flavobacteriaceae bacterium MAR_2010_72]|nr:D-mannonate dehydratase [Flavobacteriaceae bacterium MAR_2010_72]
MPKLGLGLYKSLLNKNNFEFAQQAGATHLVVQLVDYMKGGNNPSLSQNYLNGWGTTKNQGKLWEYDDLIRLKKEINSHELTWEAIENFDPSHWFDILLDGSKRDQQMSDLKYMVANVGKAGIPMIGYLFSIAGVWGWTSKSYGRGNPMTVGFNENDVDINMPIKKGMVWNMTYDETATNEVLSKISREEMWERYSWFLNEIIPVAEQYGVKMVAHPDDPPMPELRNSARLFHSISEYEKLLEVNKSPNNGLEFCLGTLQEMKEGNVLETLDKHSKAGNIGYIHFRNVKGKVPNYREVFVDEGDLDMAEAIRILKKNDYQGILIPDHSPAMSCDAPWHASMAFALGYMKALIDTV